MRPSVEVRARECALIISFLDNKWWMSLSLSHPPESRRLFVAGSVGWIISGLDLREPLHAGGVNFGDPVLEVGALDVLLNLAIFQGALQSDDLPLLEGLGEFGDSSRQRRDAIRCGFRIRLCRSSSF